MESKILNLFLYNHKLKFSDIEKSLNIRSNKLAYHLKALVNSKILIKKQDNYELSEDSEHLIPYISQKKAVLPIILIFLGNKKACFLYQRQKRPFKNYLSLPGGRILVGESLNQAVTRIMKEKFSINAKLKEIKSVSIENLKKQSKIIQTDIVIFLSASTKDKVLLTDIEKNKNKIITSDYFLIKKDLSKKIDIKTINTLKI